MDVAVCLLALSGEIARDMQEFEGIRKQEQAQKKEQQFKVAES